MCHLQHSASFATIHHPIKYKTRHLSYSISVTSINVSSTDKRHFTDPASLATIKPTAAMIPSVRNVFLVHLHLTQILFASQYKHRTWAYCTQEMYHTCK